MLAFCPSCLSPFEVVPFNCKRCGKAAPAGGWPSDTYLGALVDDGKYKVEKLLGMGGFGRVYQVSHTFLKDQNFAMKILNASMAGDTSSENEFLQEVQILMRLNHPNIVTCHDVGRLPTGELFLRMELVEGKPIHQTIHPPGILMSCEQAAKVGEMVGAALVAAHSRGILHRDLKPANILMLRDGSVRVIDFGIAKVLDGGDDSLSKVVGTPDYMAPEQLNTGQTVDGRLDVYQLGAVLHFLLTGRPPYFSQEADTTQRALLVTAKGQEARQGLPGPRPSELREELGRLSPELDALVSRMLSTDPDDRPTTEEAVAAFRSITIDHSPTRSVTTEDPPTRAVTEVTPARLAPGAQIVSTVSSRVRESRKVPPTQVFPQRVTPPHLHGPKTSPFEKRIALIPLVNHGKDEDTYLAQGLTEDLTDSLSMFEGLSVRPRGVVEALDPSTLDDPNKVARELDVNWVVEGSLRRMGERVQISLRLICAGEGFQKWASKFRCTTHELFDISEEISEALSEALATQSLGPRKKSGPSPAAVDLFLKGRYELRRHWHGNTVKAVTLLNEALEISPDDPLILSMASVAHARYAIKGSDEHASTAVRAQELAQKALHTAPERCEPYYALGLIHRLYMDTERAIEALESALERNPSYPEAHDLMGRIKLDSGPIEESVVHLRKALDLDPGMFNARFDMARGFALLKEWDKVGAMLVTEDDASTDGDLARLLRLRFEMWRGAPAHGDDLEPPEAVNDITNVTRILCEVVASGGLSPANERWLSERAEQAQATPRKTLFYQYLAETAAYTGALDKCLHTLEVALVTGLSDIVWLHHCPLFDTMSTDGRLITLRKRHPLRR